ncbi:MAG: ComEA family DNA-binding protein [Anaerolineales bacterium]|nr:ComEA family DNA-binding protein [Anaerolineales bacterium]
MGVDRRFVYGLLYGLGLALAVTGVLLVAARRPAGQPVILAEAPTPAPVRVYVLGAVRTPGVYPLARGSIVEDALKAAGGALPNADLHGLNLAQVLQDGDRVDVPEIPPTATPPPPTVTVGPGTPSPTPLPTTAATETPAPVPSRSGPSLPVAGAKININTATLAELDTLPRIGPALAQRIIDYRNANGPFRRIEDIQNVRGIGPATFERIKDLITVGP